MGIIGDGYVYLVTDGHRFKIGSTIDSNFRPEVLRREWQRCFRGELWLVHFIDCVDYKHAERWLHHRYAKKRRAIVCEEGESISGYTEWFELSQEDVAEICAIERGDEFAFPDLPESGRRRTTINLPIELKRRMQKYVARRNRSLLPMSSRLTQDKVIARALEEFLARQERDQEERIKRLSEKGYANYLPLSAARKRRQQDRIETKDTAIGPQ